MYVMAMLGRIAMWAFFNLAAQSEHGIFYFIECWMVQFTYARFNDCAAPTIHMLNTKTHKHIINVVITPGSPGWSPSLIDVRAEEPHDQNTHMTPKEEYRHGEIQYRRGAAQQ